MDSMNKKEQYVVSVINSPVPSISDEMVLRIANKHASNLNVEHVSLVLRSPITESEIIKSYFGKFSSGVVYFDDVKKLDIENFTVVCDNSISENFDDCIVVPVENISLIEHALSGDIESFKRQSFNDLREMDCRVLFNMIREHHNIEPVNYIETQKNDLREEYLSGNIFNIGDVVEHKSQLFEILDRGSNYLLVVNESGQTKRIWIKDSAETNKSMPWEPSNIQEEIFYKGYETKNFNKISEDTRNEFKQLVESGSDPYLILKTIKMMDQYIETEESSILASLQECIKKIKEDIATSDYKISSDGRRYPARRITFKNKINGK